MDASPLLHFVVLRHDGVEHPHFDLMFEIEIGGMLATWRSPVWPVVQSTPLTRLADHRREYLDYEGPISAGRGFVQQVAKGIYQRSVTNGKWIVQFIEPPGMDQIILH